MTKQRTQCKFEGAAEEHGCSCVFLLPTVEIAVAIPLRAGQVLTNLGVAVYHSGHLRVIKIRGRKFFPTASYSKAVKTEQGSAVENDLTDLNDAFETHKLPFIDLIATQQPGVIAEVL